MSIMLYSVLSTELSIKTLEYKFGEKNQHVTGKAKSSNAHYPIARYRCCQEEGILSNKAGISRPENEECFVQENLTITSTYKNFKDEYYCNGSF